MATGIGGIKLETSSPPDCGGRGEEEQAAEKERPHLHLSYDYPSRQGSPAHCSGPKP